MGNIFRSCEAREEAKTFSNIRVESPEELQTKNAGSIHELRLDFRDLKMGRHEVATTYESL
jgi:hypothetical protein